MPYKVLGMLRDAGLGKDMNTGNIHVPYMSSAERYKYLVTFQRGILWWQFAPLDTTDGHNKKYIYVMDGDGNIYTGNKREVTHHSSFLAGNPAASAGHWRVINGRVEHMNAESGHYQPTSDYCDQIIEELKKRGANVTEIEKSFGPSSEQMSMHLKKGVGITGLKWYQREKGAEVVKDYATGVTTATGEKVETGSHIKGQKLRLYPGTKPKWQWF